MMLSLRRGIDKMCTKLSISSDNSKHSDTIEATRDNNAQFTHSSSWEKTIIMFIKSDRILLTTIIVVFTSVISYFSFLRFQNFYTTNWDLGIAMQLLWTTTHGYLMFETGDFEFAGVRSFLQIHSTYIAFPVAFIYDLAPTALTLFVIQSLTLALSIIPLFLIGNNIGIKRKTLYIALVVYLLNFGLISGLLYDFHWETFLPLEFFSMFYLLLRRKYALSVVPFIIGCATLEVFPFLAAGGILYFAADRVPRTLPKHWSKTEQNETIKLATYLFVTAVSYVFIRVLQLVLIPRLAGTAENAAGIASSVGSLLVINTNADLMAHSLLYWLLLYAAFGYISLLHPRHALLALPWMFNTFFLFPSFASYFGNQYAIVAAMPLAIGFVYGVSVLQETSLKGFRKVCPAIVSVSIVLLSFLSILGNDTRLLLLQRHMSNTLLLDVLLIIPALSLLTLRLFERVKWNPITKSHHRKKNHWNTHSLYKRRNAIVLLFVALIVFNFMMSPLNTGNFNATPMPGYSFKYSPNPEYPFMKYVLSKISNNKTVVASDNLFPFVANNPKAYAIPWFPFNKTMVPYFPFNASSLPRFVLVDASQFFLMPRFLSDVVFNSSYYGLTAYVYNNQYPGSIYLFESSSHANTVYYNVSTPPKHYFFYSKNLAIGSSGKIISYPNSKFGYVIESSPANNLSGNGHTIWYGPYLTLEPGHYKVVISLMGKALNKTVVPVPLLYMNSNGFGGPTYYSETIYSSQLSSTQWTNFTFLINVQKPYPLTEFRGYLVHNGLVVYGQLMLNYIEVEYQ